MSVKRKFFSKPLLLFLLFLMLAGITSAQQGNNHTVYFPIIKYDIRANESWPTVAGNPKRTSWTASQVTGNLNVHWYLPIEAYISQNVQIIAEHGMLYISTSKGLYALNATNGAVVWRFDTELPLGNSPTIANGIAYVGGYDRKLHAINAITGQHLWSFDGAGAGYNTNPLVVNGVVYAGNRDGTMYAIGAHNTPQQGNLIWQYKTDGPIHISAAYNNYIIYFASNDMHAYALNSQTGELIWKSDKMPGMQYQSYWPVIYKGTVIFSAAHGYREGERPGLNSIEAPGGGNYGTIREVQLDGIFWPNVSEGRTIGPQVPAQAWTNGYPMVSANNITQYLEDNPQNSAHQYKPWRRMFVALNMANGQEFTFDSDQDGFPEYLPAGYWGTGSGNRYPPLVGDDGILYFGNVHECCSDSKGRVMGWNINQPGYLSVLGGFAALAEPQAISAGGEMIYRNLCCDRVGDWFSYTNNRFRPESAWSYNLLQKAPNYDPMWFVDPRAMARHQGWYTGNINSVNAAYHNHGDQNPLIPYQGRLYVHRSNTIIAFGPGAGTNSPRPLLTAQAGPYAGDSLTQQELRGRLETEIAKMVEVGHLRPGYYNMPQFIIEGIINYFENPGETLYTLSVAYPHLSPELQTAVQAYLQSEFNSYFVTQMYSRTGWSGAAREAMDLPPEVAQDLGNFPPVVGAGAGFIWQYPQHNFYAMWKYAQNVPGVDVATAYNLAKSKLTVPVPNPPTGNRTTYFRQQPYELNAWIAGYIGFLELQQLAGMAGQDAALRNQVTAELNTLLQMRVDIFSKDSYWSNPGANGYRYYKKHIDISRNFIFMVPELADYLRQHIPNQVQQAVDEYEYIAPYWFVSRYEAAIGEGGMANLYSYSGLFQAKAQILCEPQSELTKYIDVPAFARGDLLYIQNLVSALSVNSYPACH